MKIGNYAVAAGLALGMALFSAPGNAQGPLWDVVHVNMPYSVTIGDKVLQPGQYVIQQNRDAGGGSRVMLIYSNNGMKFETSAMTIPALDPDTARDTKVVLHHYGSDYYFDKIWVQGKEYGYEFPVPSSVKSREMERMASVSVPATYSNTPVTTPATTTTDTTATDTTAANTTPATDTTVASSTTPATATPVTTPDTTVTTPPATDTNSADRAMNDTPTPVETPAPTSMPATSAGWLMMLLGGGSLSGIGMALRRRR
jgi:hypothetical protein